MEFDNFQNLKKITHYWYDGQNTDIYDFDNLNELTKYTKYLFLNNNDYYITEFSYSSIYGVLNPTKMSYYINNEIESEKIFDHLSFHIKQFKKYKNGKVISIQNYELNEIK